GGLGVRAARCGGLGIGRGGAPRPAAVNRMTFGRPGTSVGTRRDARMSPESPECEEVVVMTVLQHASTSHFSSPVSR
ncbi:MAG: hypothetical protein M3Q27_05020, partial [Actinomycetota bacterium]|nr:hypothetical protein [Actinomycetota bacterium]